LKYYEDTPEEFYRQANDARNMLIHGEEVQAIEASLGIPFSDLVDRLGSLAWISIINQFAPVLAGKAPLFIQTNMYVYMTMSGLAHMKVGFVPNFANPDPSHFPQINFTFGPPSPPTPPGATKPG
jgi:hypothetical protein